ncbi:MMPL family transporter [Cryptosporangium aurantiacum]|uniref:MMPL family transporter n=1 Tax=Cryptosporangium aurantiacum TaxID=134849 RepID=UPI000A074FAE|nr:MMPL family transporter [Cryptosporangium aurantiacum]
MRNVRWLVPALLIVGWLVVGGVFGPYQAKLSEVQKNDNAAFLPSSAEATEVAELQERFVDQPTVPAIVVYLHRGGLTLEDARTIQGDVAKIRAANITVGEISPIIPSRDGEAAQVIVPLAGADGEVTEREVSLIRDIVQRPGPLTAHVAGPSGIIADFFEVFGAIDGLLIGVTALVVAVILIVVYRSPILPLVVLTTVGLALGASAGVVYALTKNGTLDLNGQSQGILSVLVFGATTDYALLLIARAREECGRHASRWDAVRAAYKGAFEPIVASGGTVIAGLLCLLFSDLASNRSLGPIGAIGIVAALLASLTFLPAVLALLGRAAFWPFMPRYGSERALRHGIWDRVAQMVSRRHRRIWIVTSLVLLLAAAFAPTFRANGVTQTDAFLKRVDAVQGEEILQGYFPAGFGTPAVVIGRAEALEPMVTAVKSVDGVEAVTPFTGTLDFDPNAKAKPPKIVDGLVEIDVTLADAADSPTAMRAVRDLREALHAVPGADALVGGYTATLLDTQTTTSRDLRTIVPIVLAVIFVILALLLRALVAPLMLIATVVLSFGATLGVAALVFDHLFGFPGSDPVVPLFAFVFLVALGIDYNIFLMTRVREESLRHGTRAGTLTGLRVTGGVITSAGVVLAATFAALSVLPILFLAQMAFLVAFGVLLDTLVVRSLLVPAATLELGRRIWWPSRAARIVDADDEESVQDARPPVSAGDRAER